MVVTPVPTAAPTMSVATESPAMGIRPSLPAGAPAIADPYWLLATGTDDWTETDADGHVQATKGMSYEVLEGGALDGTILVNAADRAILSVYTTTGKEPVPGINPIETQYGAQIDSVLPDPSLPFATHNPDNPDIWTRSTETRGGRAVYVRTAGAPPGASADAYWWGDQAAGQWFALSMQTGESGFEDILTALLGKAE